MNPSIASLIALARSSGYHEENKANWRKQSMAFLRKITKELKLTKGEYSIRFNAGGIAVSGDAVLHHNSFYLHLNDFGGYWRTCKGQKDYSGSGGANHNFNTGTFYGEDITREELIGQIKAECFYAGFPHGVQGGAGERPWEPGTSFDHLSDAYPVKKIDWENVRPCCTKDD